MRPDETSLSTPQRRRDDRHSWRPVLVVATVAVLSAAVTVALWTWTHPAPPQMLAAGAPVASGASAPHPVSPPPSTATVLTAPRAVGPAQESPASTRASAKTPSLSSSPASNCNDTSAPTEHYWVLYSEGRGKALYRKYCGREAPWTDGLWVNNENDPA